MDEKVDIPRWGPARALRLCTGADEKILAQVPSERPRYTAMGGVVFGTALLAMFSMAYALYCVFGGFRFFVVGVVLVWGLFILSLDRWLMAGAPISSGSARNRFLPRLLLSVALGMVVAEPLLLGVFDSAIQERVARDRATELADRESLLRLCNPVPGTPEAARPEANDATCLDNRLKIDGDSPERLQTELDETKRQADALRKTVDADSAAHAKLEEKARRECNGTPGSEFSGRPGVGPNCRRLRGEADRYYADHKIKENSTRLVQLDSKANSLTEQVSTARQRYGELINKKIDEELDTIRDRHRNIGLLERFRALDDLVEENGYVHATQWGLRIFLIIIDALPALLKVLNGETVYDRLNARRLRDQDRQDAGQRDADRERHATDLRFQRYRTQQQHEVRRKRFAHDVRVENANIDVAREELISARERSLLGVATGPAIDGWDLDATQEFVIDQPVSPSTDPASGPDAPATGAAS
ncbi:DUF4407 domain-containing protein [Micromonospora echinofusca]|uniref:DUF4407 domain-containing protein n=1 Tax=Micromonospora echinofusca TaxID=47858 RepID=A0ABS3VVM8_MICEH|nr:DUF4407 domain-containing protein [Micromonospora echinofusca]MBO4208459.1 DUF4407 domain-containing protein [Micromonospora echinofusca]